MAHEYLAAHIASIYGLSRIALTGDAGQANFSASRLSTETDRRTWGIYRRQIIRATRLVYAAFRGTTLGIPDLPDIPEWRHPPAIVTDPVRRADELAKYKEAGIMTTEEIRAELGLPPPPPELLEMAAPPPAAALPPGAPPPPPQEDTDDAG